MARIGLVGGTYQSESVNANAQRCLNWYPEVIESGDGASVAALYPSPGLFRFGPGLTGGGVRCLYPFNGRLFAHTNFFYEIFGNGDPGGAIYAVPDDGMPVTMSGNSAQQLLICGGGEMYVHLLGEGAATQINAITSLASYAATATQSAHMDVESDTDFPSYTPGQALYFDSVSDETSLSGMAVQVIGGGGAASNPRLLTVSTPIGFANVFDTKAQSGSIYTSDAGHIPLAGLGMSPVERVDFVNGYFIALAKNSSTVYYSGIEDGMTWSPLQAFVVSEFPENILSMMVNQNQIWLFGHTRGLVYYTTEDALLPFQPIQGSYIEHGIDAPWSLTKLDNTIFWLGSDDRGRVVAWKASGYSPVRVSNHGVEAIWDTYPTTSDAIGYSFSHRGHGFWHLYMPSADASWRYDVTTNMWHEVGFLASDDQIHHHRSRVHAYAFEKNILGDTNMPQLYVTDHTAVTDDTSDQPNTLIRRMRRAPHVITEGEWIYHHKLRLLVESGLGPMPPLRGTPRGEHTIILQPPPAQHPVEICIDNAGNAIAVQLSSVPHQEYIFVDLRFWPDMPMFYRLDISPSWNGQPGIVTLIVRRVFPPVKNWLRRLPLMTEDGTHQSSISVQAGQLIIEPPHVPYSEPRLMLRWSDDGGHKWSNEHWCGAGKQGEFTRRVEWRQLGKSRQRCYEVSVTDPIPWRIVDAYLFATPGHDPQERYATQNRKVA